jgi:nicotinamidase/pyrazinamidase
MPETGNKPHRTEQPGARADAAILWEVDVQRDFMLPDGALSVPGAMEIAPRIGRLVDAARKGRALLISSADAHCTDDAELRVWPPHCLRGSAGAELLEEARVQGALVIPNRKEFALPADLARYPQIVLEKNTLDVFENPQTEILLAELLKTGRVNRETRFLVLGVTTEHCVRLAAEGLMHRGWRVAVITDAIRALDPERGEDTLRALAKHGAERMETNEALRLLESGTDRTGSRDAGMDGGARG